MIRVAALLLLAGCASLPPCPRPQIMAQETEDGTFYILDGQNMVRMAALLEGLSTQSCKPVAAQSAPAVPATPAAPAGPAV